MEFRGHQRALTWLMLLAVLAVAEVPTIAATPEQACDALKLKVAANAARSQIVCHAKAIAKGMEVDGECLQKAADKYSFAWDKAEKKGPCASKSAGDIKDLVDAFVNGLVPTVLCRSQNALCTFDSDCCGGDCDLGFCFF